MNNQTVLLDFRLRISFLCMLVGIVVVEFHFVTRKQEMLMPKL